MAAVHCHFPITVHITGWLDEDALARLAAEVERAVGERIARAESELARHRGAHPAPPVVSRQASLETHAPGMRQAEVEVAWSDDQWEFEERVVSAVARSRSFRGIPRSSLPFALNRPAAALHETLYRRNFKPGRRIRVKVSASYDLDNIPEFTDVTVAIVEPAAAQLIVGDTPPPPAQPERRERGHPSLKDQRDTLQRMYSRLAADADTRGWSGITFEVSNNGKELRDGSKAWLEPRVARPTNTVPLSEQAASSELEHFLDVVVQYPGHWKATFSRNASGAMHLRVSERLFDAPPPAAAPGPAAPAGAWPRSDAEDYEMQMRMADMGNVYPERINKALQSIAIRGLHEANPLSLKNLPYTIAGAVIPIGAMKLLTTDFDALGNVVRFEWQIDEELVEATETQGLKTPMQPEPASGAAPPTSEVKPGDVIPTRNMGPQRVVEIKPGGKLVTEPVRQQPPESSSGAIADEAPGTAPEKAPRATTAKRAPEVIDQELLGVGPRGPRYRPVPAQGVDPYQNYVIARDSGIRSAGLGSDQVPHLVESVGEGNAHLVGRHNGYMSPDGSRGWRLDYSPEKGGHINWWRVDGDVRYQGSTQIAGGDEATFFKLLQGHFGAK